MSYTFKSDVEYINLEMMKQGLQFSDCFVTSKNQHSYILKAFYRNSISIETLVILEKLFGYVETYDTAYKDDIMWPDLSRIIKKYSPFLNVNKEKYNDILTRAIGPT